MSDLFAVLVVGRSALHCVDFDRPYWYAPGAFDDGVVPNADHFVVDALLALAADQVLSAGQAAECAGLLQQLRRDLDKTAHERWDALRAEVYGAGRPGLLYVAVPTPDSHIEQDLARLNMPVVRARTEGSAEMLRS